jgi:hypothetical protein
MLNRLKAFNDVTAILAVPHWRGHTYWGMLRHPGQFIPEIRAHIIMEPSFFDTRTGMSLFTRRKGISMWFAVYKSGSGLIRIGKQHKAGIYIMYGKECNLTMEFFISGTN